MIDVLLIILTVFLCCIGLLLSALALSGTWMVLASALLVKWAHIVHPPEGEAVGWEMLIVFALLCIAVEAFEALAGFMGVQKRGGSRRAGVAALFGGLIGAVVGSGFLPVIGTLLGMLAGSFALAFLVERNRLQHDGQAAHIAWGTVWARLTVLFTKTVLTLGMSIWLIWVML